MSSIKIYPPNTLPAENITDTQFAIWREHLEVYLEIEEKFRQFLQGGRYAKWIPAEQNEKRILTVVAPDSEEQLPEIRRNLRQFITIIAKYVHIDHFNPILRHSTSLEWIYKKIREDYDIQLQGIHFLNIIDLEWDPTGQQTPIGFYNHYRSLIIGNLAKKDSRIEWKNEVLTEDERLTPSHEDLIFINVLRLIHPKLPSYVRDNYAHQIGINKRIMDYKTEILSKAKQYIQEIEAPLSANISTNEIEEPQCNYVSNYTQRNTRPNYNRSQNNQQRRYQQYQRPKSSYQNQPTPASNQPPPFCRVCQLSGLSRAIYTSHFLGQASCPSLSAKDKQLLTTRVTEQLNAIDLEEEDNIAKEYGYTDEDLAQQMHEQHQVTNIPKLEIKQNPYVNSNFSKSPTCNFIQPIPSQTLSVQDINNKDIHLDLDSGATVSYAKLSSVLAHGFKIKPNSQLSNLADGKTKLPSIGEIDEMLYRNSWSVRLHAIVTKNLHCEFVAGNNFIKENSVIQDLNSKTISVHKKYTIAETSKSLILPTQPNNLLVQNNHLNVILPGQEVNLPVPHQEHTVLAVQPWHQNKNDLWPEPQLCAVQNGQICIKNNLPEPVQVKDTAKLQVRTLSDQISTDNKYVNNNITSTVTEPLDTTKMIEINKDDIHPDIIRYVTDIHDTYKDVFDNDLSNGYNHRYGKHIAKLNWAGSTKPTANKVQNVNYDQATKKLLQEVCDDLTNKGVLGIPQEYNVSVQYCSPSFLVRKQKAKNKSKQDLNKDDVRLVINFTKLNDYLKNLPTSVTKPKDIFSQLGKWNYIITMDLHSGFFQNHMSEEDAQWLGITTPFGGLRFLKRSGQGLIGQSEEPDEMLSKILGPEMMAGKVSRIADDIYIGGRDPKETADNYLEVLKKFQAANIKISPGKTKVFLKSVDILGWKWKQGGFLSPSPHRVNALKNTKYEDIKTVKDLRSYLGLYKTLLPASPNLTLILNPFDQEVADRDSKHPIEWDRDLIEYFRIANEAVDKLQTLYLPHPDDQLLIEVDAAKSPPGIGHTLYAIKEGKKLPVAFHSVKLNPNHSKWMACELEALAFATAVNAEYETLKECTKPIIITPDSKPVADAVKLIKKGQYSSSPRVQSFISNINRLPIIVQLASGKSKQNQSSDYQSRHPSKCSSQHCSICSFVLDTADSVLIPAAINHLDATTILHSKSAWNQIQDQQKACRDAKYLLKSGKTPTKQSGKVFSEIRRLCAVAKLSKDNLLIVPSQQNKYSTSNKDLIVIPQTHLPAVIWQIHNQLEHPTRSQLKANFDKSFYSVGLNPALDQLYEECFYCSTQKKIPLLTPQHTETQVKVPGTHFHGDVIRRQSQCIFIVRDHLSSFTAAKIIKNESHQELKSALIDTIVPIKLAGECSVKVDNAKGFCPLTNKKDPELNKLNINIYQSDVFNKNENAVVDKACFEIEQELKRIEPDGRPISNTTLQVAVGKLNNKLRRQGQISSFEIHFNRDMNTGQNMNLDYEKIRLDQLKIRRDHNDKHNSRITQQQTHKPQPGDIVVVKTKEDKHKAKDVFLVSDVEQDKVSIQKIIHPHSKEANIRSKQYSTKVDRVCVTNKFHKIPVPVETNSITRKKCQSINQWNPIREIDHEEDDDDADTKHIIQSSTVHNQGISYQSFVRLQTSPTKRPPLYEQLDQSIERQRITAASQLRSSQSTENISVHQAPIHPEPITDVVNTYERPIRSQKIAAKDKITACLYPHKKIIPQVDGFFTDSDPNTTPDVSPDTSEHTARPRHSSTDDNLLANIVYDSDESYDWDYSAIQELRDPSEVFDTPPMDNSFMHPPLNLSATSENLQTDRVYTFNTLLDRLRSTYQTVFSHQRNRPGASSLKKGNANL